MSAILKRVIDGLIRPKRQHGEARSGMLAAKRSEDISENETFDGATFRLVAPVRPAATPVERLAVEILKREGRTSLKRLVADVAREVYFDEVRRGAWVLDIGLYGPDLFVTEVISELNAANGILWKIESQEERGNGALPDLS